MFEKVITNSGKKGTIDAEVNGKYRISLKDGGYDWAFTFDVKFISQEQFYSNDDIKKETPKKNGFRHHNVDEGY